MIEVTSLYYFMEEKILVSVENTELLPLVEKHPKCMKFMGKNSTDLQIKEKIRLGKEFACYLSYPYH
jgi:hypothetical protein